MNREDTLVELVNASGLPIGTATVAAAHTAPGQRHRAFSVLLHDGGGRILLQQRAADKTRFPLRWSNTCCGHPAPGEHLHDAAAKRLTEELGLIAPEFTEVGVHSYQATDSVTGRVEIEYDHVLIGQYGGPPPFPDPAEVASWRWVALTEIDSKVGDYTPWLAGVLMYAAPHVSSS